MPLRFHRASFCDPRSRAGFGLVELMITVAIMAVLAAIALPSYNYLIRSNRVSSEANDFLTAVKYARNESITRTRGVTLCAADTSGDDPPTVCSGTWTSGWMVFVDDTAANLNTTPAAIAETAVLRTWVGNTHNTIVPDAAQTFIRFNPRGQSKTDPAGDVTFTLKPVNDCSDKQQREIVVSELGRSSISQVTCS